MINTILEELDIPRPPYRMARPVARLAVAEKPWDDEVLRKQEQERRIQEEESWKKFGEQSATPEQVDASVDKGADAAKERIGAAPSPNGPAAEAQVDAVQKEYHAQTLRTSGQVVGEALSEILAGQTEPTPIPANPVQERADLEAVMQEREAARIHDAKRYGESSYLAEGHHGALEHLARQLDEISPAAENRVSSSTLEEKAPLDVSVLSETARQNYEKAKSAGKSVAPTEKFIREQMVFRAEHARKAEEELAKKEVKERGSKVGDIVTEGKVSARVLEVNAEGRPTAPEAEEEPVPIMQVTPEQQAAFRVAGEQGIQVEKEAKEKREREASAPEARATAPSPDESLDILRQAQGSAKESAATAEIPKIPAETLSTKEIESERVNMPPSPEIGAVRAAAEAKNAEPKETRPPAPKPVERPRVGAENPLEHAAQKEEEAEHKPLREHIGSFDYVRGAFDWAVEKSGTRPWLDTLAPRLESVFHRQMAELRMMQQVRAQGLLNRANNKLSNWEATAQDAGWPMKLFYANRVRAWQKHANKCEARVDKYESVRHRWQEKHNDLQRQVSERYERELWPYRELTAALKSKEAAALDVQKNLSELRRDALKKLSIAKADAGKRSTLFMSSRARRAIKEIEQEVKSLERLEAQANKSVAKARAPLARAQAGIDKWALKQKTVAQRMKFPEAAGLTRPKRVSVEMPSQEGIATTVGPESVAEPEGATLEQRMAEEWQPADFVKRWNAYNVELAIEKPDEFTAFVASERARLHQEGIPTRQQLLNLTQQYQQLRLSPNAMKKFKASRDLFAAKVNK